MSLIAASAGTYDLALVLGNLLIIILVARLAAEVAERITRWLYELETEPTVMLDVTAAQELEAVAGPRGLAPAQIGERDALRERVVEGVAREERACDEGLAHYVPMPQRVCKN